MPGGTPKRSSGVSCVRSDGVLLEAGLARAAPEARGDRLMNLMNQAKTCDSYAFSLS